MGKYCREFCFLRENCHFHFLHQFKLFSSSKTKLQKIYILIYLRYQAKAGLRPARPILDCRASYSFGVLSTSRFAPPALSSSIDDPKMSHDSRGAPIDLLWLKQPQVIHGGPQLNLQMFRFYHLRMIFQIIKKMFVPITLRSFLSLDITPNTCFL